VKPGSEYASTLYDVEARSKEWRRSGGKSGNDWHGDSGYQRRDKHSRAVRCHSALPSLDGSACPERPGDCHAIRTILTSRTIYYLGMFGGFALAAVVLVYKPDTR